jgi:hypothetical protein
MNLSAPVNIGDVDTLIDEYGTVDLAPMGAWSAGVNDWDEHIAACIRHRFEFDGLWPSLREIRIFEASYFNPW